MSVTSMRDIRLKQAARQARHDVEIDPVEQTARRLEACGYSAETARYAAQIMRDGLIALRTGRMPKS